MLALGREPTLVAAMAIGALAAIVIGLRPRSVLHRALALFLLLVALTFAMGSYLRGFDDPVDRLFLYAALGVPFAAMNFGYVFWQDNIGPGRAHPWYTRGSIRLGILAVAAVVETAYLLDHSLFLRADADGRGALRPLGYLAETTSLWFAALGLLLAWAHTRAMPALRRRSLLLGALAFSVDAAFQAPYRVSVGLERLVAPGSAPERAIDVGIATVMGILVIATAAVLLASRRKVAEPSNVPIVGIAVGLPAITGLVAAHLGDLVTGAAYVRTVFALDAFWHLCLVLIAVYSVLRYEFFGIELRVKIALRQSTVVAIIAGVFVVTSEVLERVIPVEDAYIAVGVAVGIAFMMRGIQRVAEGVVERVMPDVNKGEAYLQRRRHEIYRAALEDVMRDGLVKPQEAIMLDRLRDKLGIAVNEAHAIEADVGAPTSEPPAAERWTDERLRGYS